MLQEIVERVQKAAFHIQSRRADGRQHAGRVSTIVAVSALAIRRAAHSLAEALAVALETLGTRTSTATRVLPYTEAIVDFGKECVRIASTNAGSNSRQSGFVLRAVFALDALAEAGTVSPCRETLTVHLGTARVPASASDRFTMCTGVSGAGAHRTKACGVRSWCFELECRNACGWNIGSRRCYC